MDLLLIRCFWLVKFYSLYQGPFPINNTLFINLLTKVALLNRERKCITKVNNVVLLKMLRNCLLCSSLLPCKTKPGPPTLPARYSYQAYNIPNTLYASNINHNHQSQMRHMALASTNFESLFSKWIFPLN